MSKTQLRRKALTRKQRQLIWAKSGGKCWYCGSDLPEKGWHADHVEPVLRELKVVPREERKNPHAFELRQTGDAYRPENDRLDNIVPACAPCNLFKSTFSVEQFRKEIEAQIDRARRSSVNFRTAERFGLIEAKPVPVVFWFERHSGVNR